MASFRSAFPSKFMKATDLNGRTLIATIASVDLEAVGDGNKYVARFTDDHVKPIVLNLTNSEAIAEVAGSEDVTEWPGHKIEMFPDSTSFQGRRIACIRVRAPRQAKPARPGGTASAPARRATVKPAPEDIDDAMPPADDDTEY